MNITDLQPTHTREVQNHYKFHQTANGILWQPIVKQVAHLWNESAQNDAAKRTVRSVPKLPNAKNPNMGTKLSKYDSRMLAVTCSIK